MAPLGYLFSTHANQMDLREQASLFGLIRTQDRQISVLGLARAALPTSESSLLFFFFPPPLSTAVCVVLLKSLSSQCPASLHSSAHHMYSLILGLIRFDIRRYSMTNCCRIPVVMSTVLCAGQVTGCDVCYMPC